MPGNRCTVCVLRALTWGALSFPPATDGGDWESKELLDEPSNDLDINMEIIAPPAKKKGETPTRFRVNTARAPKPLLILIPSIFVSENGFQW